MHPLTGRVLPEPWLAAKVVPQWATFGSVARRTRHAEARRTRHADEVDARRSGQVPI